MTTQVLIDFHISNYVPVFEENRERLMHGNFDQKK